MTAIAQRLADAGIEVKPLEWRGTPYSRSTLGDLYEITQLSDNVWSVTKNGTALNGWETSFDDAKAAAQADYTARILVALQVAK